MDTISRRLKQFLDFKDMNASALAVALGYESSEKISRLFRFDKNPANPSAEILQDIANKFAELNMAWLLTGRGSMFVHSTKTPPEPSGNEGVKTVEVNAEDIMSLLLKIKGDQDKVIASLKTISNPPETTPAKRPVKSPEAETAEKVARRSVEISTPGFGKKNPPLPKKAMKKS